MAAIVSGAVVAHQFRKDADRESSFRPAGDVESAVSDVKGEATLPLAFSRRHPKAMGFLAIREDPGSNTAVQIVACNNSIGNITVPLAVYHWAAIAD